MKKQQNGFVLITTILMLSLLTTLLGAYYLTTSLETGALKYSVWGTSGFYAAEAGLNVRAEEIRSIFVGFNRPTGTSPVTSAACEGTNVGAGDFACASYSFNNRAVTSYVEEDPSNPVILTIPPGERYQNLNAQEYRYTAKSLATNVEGVGEAQLELRFKSRLVPLFQFAAFYNKDLEILPGPVMSLAGPVHTNGDLYLYSNSTNLDIWGQVTTAGDLYRGSKDARSPSCNNRPVRIANPNALTALIPACPSRYKVLSSDIPPWNGMIQMQVQDVTVPGPEVFDPTTGAVYWDRADMRLVLALDGSNNLTGIQVRNADDSVDNGATTTLNACAGTPVQMATIRNFREQNNGYNFGGTAPNVRNIRILDVNMQTLLNCLHNSSWFGTGKLLSDTTDGGLVFHMTVKGPSSALLPNPYGVRVRNGATLGSSVGGAPLVRGLTIVSDQAFYIQGNYNSSNKIPAAVMADSLNTLSNNWNDANSTAAIASRVATSTTINSAFLAGTDSTGGVEGAGGQGVPYPAQYNGGLENYPRFHENWSGRVLTYRGSFVSLGTPRYVNGPWGIQSYSPPNRDWNYDTSFNNAANLPPITPRFVYLRQELFVRDFEKDE